MSGPPGEVVNKGTATVCGPVEDLVQMPFPHWLGKSVFFPQSSTWWPPLFVRPLRGLLESAVQTSSTWWASGSLFLTEHLLGAGNCTAQRYSAGHSHPAHSGWLLAQREAMDEQ